MKNIYYLSILLLAAMGSCKKFLDTKPTDSYTPVNYYNTEAQMRTALTTGYGNLINPQLYGQVLNFNFAASNDELLSNRTADGDARGLRFNFDATLVYSSNIWRFVYVGISNMNQLIDNIDKPSMNEDSRKNIKGQALFLRGFYYFLITSYFGDAPLILHLPGLSDVNIPAAKQADIYVQIEKDLKEAETLLAGPATAAKLGYNEIATQSAAQALLARVYLYWAGYPQNNTAKYNDVITYADKLINSGLHSLNPDYRQVFINLMQDKYDVKENIWEIGSYTASVGTIVRSGNDIGNFVGVGTAGWIASDSTSFSATGWVYTTKNLYDAYGTDPANPNTSFDVRRDWNCAAYSWSGNTPKRLKLARPNPWQFYSGKFNREFAPAIARLNGIYGINWPVIRYADILLMKAEAENYVNGPTAAAYDAINQVRRRGYGNLAGNVVKSISVTNGGSGYLAATPPVVTITGGGGSGATATAVVSATGEVTGIVITNKVNFTAATYYTSAPTITIAAPGTGTTATAVATITATNDADLTPGLGKAGFQLAIRDERLKELNAEALRRFDLIRWGNYAGDIKVYADWAEANGCNISATGNPNGLQGLRNITTKHNLLPISVYDLNLDRALIQNPGW